MKILFIVHDLYQDDNYFPSGVGYMAAILTQAGHEVMIANQDIYHYSNEELCQLYLKGIQWDIIGLGFLSARFSETIIPLCREINKHKGDAWLVLGGAGASAIPEYNLQITGADVIVIGECEANILKLAEAKAEGNDISNLYNTPNVAYIEKGKFREMPSCDPIKDLDSLPLPAYDLFPMDKYTRCLRPFGAAAEDIALGILTSRGCTNRCTFCYRLERGIRFRSIDKVIEEMQMLNTRYGVNYFVMYDELFVFPKKRVVEFRDKIKASGLKIKYSCNARVDIFDEETAQALLDSGCQFLNFGFESSSQEVLDLMKKHATVEQNLRAIEICKKFGISIGLNFLWGCPGDTKQSLMDNVNLIKNNNAYDQLRTIRPVTPYPGCNLFKTSLCTNQLTSVQDFFDRFKNSDRFTVNYTELSEQEYYEALFAANSELIRDHYAHTNGDMDKAESLIQDFHNLYFGDNTNFRGARHYEKE